MSEPRTETRPALPAVYIATEANLQEWGPVTQLVPEVLAWVEQRGLQLTAPPFFRYWKIGDEVERFHLAVGAPVDRAVAGDDRIQAGEVPAGTYATVTHVGHPDRIEETNGRLERWIQERGMEIAGHQENGAFVFEGRFEFFGTDPQIEPDPERWETEVAYLLETDEAGPG